MFHFTTLDNGLTVLAAPDPKARSMSVAIFLGVGSRFEKKRESGIFHFLEHMAFRGTEKYPDKFELAKIVEGFGGQWNGGTSKEWTKYWIKAGAKHLSQSLDILGEMVFHPLLRREDIEVERGVIIEEINLYEDDPQTHVHEIIDGVMWPEQPLGRNTAGTRGTVRSLGREDFLHYIKTHYVPKSVIVGAAGAIDEREFLSEVEKRLDNLEDIEAPGFEEVVESQTTPQVEMIKRETEQTHFCLNFRGFSFDHPQRFAMDLLSVILGGGFCSRLFQEIREKRGLAYSISASPFHHQDTGAVQIYAGVDNLRVAEAVEVTLSEVKKMWSGVSREELKIAKEKVKGGVALALEDHADWLDWLAKQKLLTSEVLAYDGWQAKIDQVSLEDIEQTANELFTSERLNFALIGLTGGEEVRNLVVSF